MKKKLLLCLSAVFLLLLTACGIEVDTSLSVNDKFEGKRTILCSMKKNDIKALNKNLTSLNSVIEENCPKSMTYQDQSDEDQFQYKFTISFSSLKDYKKKVNDCLNFAAKINYSYSNSPFANGLLYNENFTSRELMAWFSESLVEEEILSESEADSIWSIKDTSFIFNGEKHVMDDKITIDTMEYLPLDHINVYTEELENGGFKRKILFQIPKESLDKSSKSIRTYLTGHLNSSYEVEWDSVENGKTCTIAFHAKDVEQLTQRTQIVLKSDGSSSCNTLINETEPFQFKKGYKENYPLTSFASTSDGKVNYKLYYKPSSHSTLPDFKEKQKDGYYLIYNGSSKKLQAAFNELHTITFASYQLSTIYHSDSHVQRELWLHYENRLSAEELDILRKYCKKCGFSTIKNVDDQTLFFLSDGSPSYVTSAFDQVFQTKNTIKVSTKKHLFGKSQTTEVQDYIDLSQITWNSEIKGTYYFISNSNESMKKVTLDSDSKVTDLTEQNTLEKSSVSDSSNLSEFKGAYKASMSGNIIHTSYTGGVTDIYGSILVTLALLVIGLCVIIMIAYRYRTQLKNLLKLKRGS